METFDYAGVVKWQKILLLIILGIVLIYIINIALAATGNLTVPPPAEAAPGTPATMAPLGLATSGVSFLLSIGAIVAIVMLGGAMGWGVGIRVVCALLMFCPIINLITLLVVNAKATGALKAAGYKVGLMGASGGPTG